MVLKDQEAILDKLIDCLEIDMYSDETFVITGAMKDYNGKKGLKTLINENSPDDIIRRVEKTRIGNKLYTYEKALEMVKNGFCSKIGLWIPKGLIVLDTDTDEASKKVLEYINEKKINTPIVKTKKGYHFYFRFDLDVSQMVAGEINIGVKVDYRVAGKGYVVLPFNDSNRKIINICEPEFIRNSLLPTKKSTSLSEVSSVKACEVANDKVKKFQEGSRNQNLFKYLSGYINSQNYRDRDSFLALGIGLNILKCNPPLAIEEVETIVKSVIEHYKLPEFYDEKGNIDSSMLAETVAHQITYKYYMNKHCIYNGEYYSSLESIEQLQKIVYDFIDNSNKRKTRTINEVIDMLKMNNFIKQQETSKFITVENGLISLDDFKIYEHSKDIFTMFKVPCKYYHDSITKLKGSRFEKFLKTTFKNDEKTILIAGEVLGASLLPNPKKFKTLVCLLGEGSNGKSVFINILKALHGNIVSSVPLKNLDNGGNGQNFELYNMVGKNVNIDADASGTRLEATENLKKITTGDAVSLVKKGEQAYTAVLNVLLVIALNKMPSSQDKSFGFARRFRILPFEQEFADESDLDKKPNALAVDLTLEDDILKKEMDIVLAFALEGLKRLLNNNYKTTKSARVEEATNNYIEENDSVLAFKNDCDINGEFTFEIHATDLFSYYETWCINNELPPVNKTTFGRRYKTLINDTSWKRKNTGIIYTEIKVIKDSKLIWSRDKRY